LAHQGRLPSNTEERKEEGQGCRAFRPCDHRAPEWRLFGCLCLIGAAAIIVCGAPRVYAWSHETDTPLKRLVTVLQIPPVVSPLTAVRVAILEEYKGAQQA
jgi:hypothetical protein